MVLSGRPVAHLTPIGDDPYTHTQLHMMPPVSSFRPEDSVESGVQETVETILGRVTVSETILGSATVTPSATTEAGRVAQDTGRTRSSKTLAATSPKTTTAVVLKGGEDKAVRGRRVIIWMFAVVKEEARAETPAEGLTKKHPSSVFSCWAATV